jgi:hypothetical protein
LRLSVRGGAFLQAQHKHQQVDVLVNGTQVGSWAFDSAEASIHEAVIPVGLASKGKGLEIVFEIEHPRSPAELGLWPDDRLLGLGVIEAVLK